MSYKGKGKELENAVAKTINTLLEPVTKRNIPFAVTFGNHDRQVGISNKDQFNDIYKALPNCIGTQAEGIDGGGTYNIPIKASDGSDRDAFNLYLFDSGTEGKKGTFAVRLQPNHPTDNVKGVTASLLEGLSYGAGDAVLGLNPAIDNVKSTTDILNLFNDVKSRLKIPTQICVLSHITTQLKALKSGAPMDLCFQSIAGSEKALASFGTDVDMLAEANELMASKGTSIGPNYMYFETGQGSELSSNSHNGADQLVMESRCYGLARHYNPFLVNTVVGFIGPEYIYDTKELIRAALEDNFCGHMHGLPMGCYICYTNHMKADQNDSDSLLVMLSSAGCHYVMSIPQSDDVMLMYQSTSYHDIAAIREMLGLSPIEEFKQWLEGYGIWENGHLGKNAGNPRIFL